MKRLLSSVCLGIFLVTEVAAQEMPAVRIENGASQFLVQGKPFLILAGEVGNSPAGGRGGHDSAALAGLHFNTVLMPVAWGEPRTVVAVDEAGRDRWRDAGDPKRREQFSVMGSGLRWSFCAIPTSTSRPQVLRRSNRWRGPMESGSQRGLNGDQSDQGRRC